MLLGVGPRPAGFAFLSSEFRGGPGEFAWSSASCTRAAAVAAVCFSSSMAAAMRWSLSWASRKEAAR